MNEEPTVLGMTRNDWVKFYLSLTPYQRRKLDRLVREVSSH